MNQGGNKNSNKHHDCEHSNREDMGNLLEKEISNEDAILYRNVMLGCLACFVGMAVAWLITYGRMNEYKERLQRLEAERNEEQDEDTRELLAAERKGTKAKAAVVTTTVAAAPKKP